MELFLEDASAPLCNDDPLGCGDALIATGPARDCWEVIE